MSTNADILLLLLAKVSGKSLSDAYAIYNKAKAQDVEGLMAQEIPWLSEPVTQEELEGLEEELSRMEPAQAMYTLAVLLNGLGIPAGVFEQASGLN